MAVTGRAISVIQMAEGDNYGGPLKITEIWWTGGTTAGHLCTFLDASGGTEVCSMVADAANFTDVRRFPGPNGKGQYFTDLYLDDLDSGEVHIHLA